MIRILLILTLIPSILFSQFTVTTTSESWDKEKKEWKPFEDFDKKFKKAIKFTEHSMVIIVLLMWIDTQLAQVN